MESKVCRICLNSTATVSLFEKEEQDGIEYSVKIMRFVKIVISEDDGLPQSICGGCVSELAVSYNFVQKCEAADNALRTVDLTNSLLASNIELDLKQELDVKDEPLDSDFPDFLLEDDKHKVENFKKIKGKYERKKYKKRYKSGPIQCIICGLMVNCHSAMEIHMRTHTGEKPYCCGNCGAKFCAKGTLKRHIETHHNERERQFTCETCGSSFYRKNDIRTHMRIHTGEMPYACPFCSKRFKQIASLIRHKRTHTGEKPYSCHICDKKFGDKSLANKHLSVHSDEKKYSCHLCDKSVKSKAALKIHLRLHTNGKQHVCSVCGMSFSMKGNMKTHMKRVHSERSGQCSVCLRTFSDLADHMHKHTGEKPFVCSICNHAFGTKRSLANHMVFKHENASKFKCSLGECTKTFPIASMLEFHLLKQHTNHTPYVCPHCSRGFFRTSDLTRHLKVSHMDLQTKATLKIDS